MDREALAKGRRFSTDTTASDRPVRLKLTLQWQLLLQGKKFGISAVQRTIKRYTIMREGTVKSMLESVDWDAQQQQQSLSSSTSSTGSVSGDDDAASTPTSSTSPSEVRHGDSGTAGGDEVKRRHKKAKSSSLKKRDLQPTRRMAVVAVENRRAIFAYTV
jgi:hypothetical protein